MGSNIATLLRSYVFLIIECVYNQYDDIINPLPSCIIGSVIIECVYNQYDDIINPLPSCIIGSVIIECVYNQYDDLINPLPSCIIGCHNYTKPVLVQFILI